MARTERPIATTPHLGTVVLGLVLLGIAGATLLAQGRHGDVNWSAVLPYAVLGAGAVLVTVGLIVQPRYRRRRPRR
ncbi:MAG: hypothetical protein V9G19_22290 [Tetrasphaera sp.]